MKIFLGTTNVASQLTDWKIGFEANGCHTSIGSYGNHSSIVEGEYNYLLRKKHNHKLSFIDSYTVNKAYNKFLDRLYGDSRRRLLRKLIKEYDVFFFIWSSILDGFDDFEIIKDAGKKIIVQHVGDDVRWEPAAKQEFIKYGLRPIEYENYSYSALSLETRLRFIRMSEKYADLIYSRPNQAMLYLRNYGVNPYIVNSHEFQEVNKQRKKPLLFHFPSSSSFKGTKYVISAVDILKKAGIEFDFETTGKNVTYSNLTDNAKIPYVEIKKKYADCDILIGQLLCSGGGKQERELLASGKIVMSNMSPHYETHLPKENPIIDVNPDNLAVKLQEIILDYDKRLNLAKLGRPFVEEFHNPVKITARILEEITSGQYMCPIYQPQFFRNEFLPESPNYINVYNKWTEFVKNEDWYKMNIRSGERVGLSF